MKAVSAFLFICVFGLVACSENGAEGKLDSPEKDSPKQSDKGKSETSSVTLRGEIDEGFYIVSAKVELIELDSNLTQTGYIVTGTVDSLGNYNVTGDNFKSRFAELSVYGKEAMLCWTEDRNFKFSVIVDLSTDSIVNINNFVQLASARAKWLIQNEKMTFDAAWEQAEQETHKVFGLPKIYTPIRNNMPSEEYLVLMNSVLSMFFEDNLIIGLSKNFEGRKAVVEETFSKTGKLSVSKDDSFSKEAMFSYVVFAQSQWPGTFPSCDNFLLKNKIEIEPTLNEKTRFVQNYIHYLWLGIQDESECTPDLDGEIHKFAEPSQMSVSEDKAYYICDASYWRFLKEMEFIEMKYDSAQDGDFRTYNYHSFVYDEKTGWRSADSTEYSIRVGCTWAREGQEFNMSFLCHNGFWQDLNVDSVYAITCNDKGEPIQKGEKIPNYVCVSGKAFVITEMDKLLGKYCTDSNAGDTVWVGYSRAVCDDDWKWLGTPLDSLKDSRDGKKYPVVGIGKQRWLGHNLNYSDSTTNENLRGNIWCDYSCGTSGVYYSWTAAMDVPDTTVADSLNLKLPYRGICPEGWHLPSSAEWDTLQAFVNKYDLSTDIPVRSLMGGHWADYTKSKNTFGFDAPASGRRTNEGKFENEDFYAYYWYVEAGVNKYSYYYISHVKDVFLKGAVHYPNWGITVRCVADEEN